MCPIQGLMWIHECQSCLCRRLKTPEESLMAPKTVGARSLKISKRSWKNLSLIQSIVLERRKRYLAKMQDQYNKNATSADFEINSYVMVKRKYFKIADHQKLYTRWTGPKQVIKRKMTYNTYLVNSDSDLLNPTVPEINAMPSVGNEIRATPNDGTATNKHSATPGAL